MNQRRNFIKTGSLAALAAPLMSFDSRKKWSLEPLVNTYSDTEEYWRMIRKQFPLKEGADLFQ